MLRRLTKAAVANALHWTQADDVIGVLAASKHLPLVICYHSVVEDIATDANPAIPASLITRRMLERHLDWLGRRFRFISLDELGSRLEGGRPFDEPAVAITFDDGYEAVYRHAFPLLKRKGIPAALFVVTDLVGTERLQIYDKLYVLLARAFSRWSSAPRELARLLLRLGMPLRKPYRTLSGDPFGAMRALFTAFPQDGLRRVIEALEAEVEIDERALTGLRPLSWEMVLTMHRAGMTIGSHTRTHALLTNESPERVLDEIAGSRRELEGKLGIAIHHLAYPDGRFTAATVRAVAASGYRFAYTTCTHRDSNDPLLTIPRILLWENACLDPSGRFSQAIMSCQVHGVFNFLGNCGQDHNA